MLKKLSNRYFIIGILIAAVFISMLIQLLDIQIRQGEYYLAQSQERKRKTLPLKGTRGKIMDAEGIPLAYDKKSYDIEFYKDPSRNTKEDRSEYTRIIRDTIKIIEKNGGVCIDTFPIIRDEKGYHFEWGNLQEQYAQRREELWRKNMYVKNDINAEEVFMELRERYQIPDDVGYEEAHKILSVWQEVQLSSYKAYVPVKIAKNVNMTTVAEIETRNLELTGMNVAEGTVRVYPKGSLAAHIIGYTGRITVSSNDIESYKQKIKNDETLQKEYDSKVEEYKAKGYSSDQIEESITLDITEKIMQDYEKMGYSRDDLVGRSGVEATMESELTGNIKQRQGYRIVEVNNRGKVTREIETVSAQAGNNVILSIDSKLQKQLEEALEKNIQKVRQMQQEQYETNKGEYESLVQARGYPINMAETGAAVVMDIHTGEILAMASYPSYDPNNFVDGISHEEYATIEQDKRYPLMNKAISSKGTPGSVFKMLTGLAGLMEGKVKVDEEIDDAGEYRKHVDESYKGKVPSCWVRPNFYLHKQEDIVKALKDSCNYYFYEVSSRLGIDLLTKWSDMLGLTSKTGIELPGEAVGQTANQEVLLKTSIRALVSQRIKELIKQRTGIAYNDDLLNTVVNELLELYSDSTPGPIIRQILKEKLNITSAQVRSDLGAEIAGYLTEIRWDPNKTIVAGIGQSVTTLTPIGVTRYIAALVNGGKVMEAHVVKQVTDPEGNVILDKEPVVVRDLDIPDLYLEKIKEGMREVISLEDGGTAAKEFKDFEYKDDIGGKTGTAQVSNIDLENNAWFVAFAPFDKPEIAVTVFIPNGYKGAYAAETVKEIVQLYMDRKMKTGTESIPAFSELVP